MPGAICSNALLRFAVNFGFPAEGVRFFGVAVAQLEGNAEGVLGGTPRR